MIVPCLFPFDRFCLLGTFDEDMTFRKTVTFSVKPGMPAGAFGDTEHDSTRPLGVNKTRHQHQQMFGQNPGAVVAAGTHIVHVARGAGTLKDVRALLTVPNGAASTVTIDFQKAPAGGPAATVLTGTFVIPASGAAYTAVIGSLDPLKVDYAAGDTFLAVVTVAGGALGQGLAGTATFDELNV